MHYTNTQETQLFHYAYFFQSLTFGDYSITTKNAQYLILVCGISSCFLTWNQDYKCAQMKSIQNLISQKAFSSAHKNRPNKISTGIARTYIICDNVARTGDNYTKIK
jgi:hypothetical protein